MPNAEREKKLEIDEGPKSITGKNTANVEFKNTKTQIPIEMIGELRTDERGRLLVLGGKGQSNSSVTPPEPLINYANNDNWFDDVADGPVTAVVTIKNQAGDVEQISVEGAWVLVGPPDFGPSIQNVVTLYDALWDVSVRKLKIPADNALYDEYAPGKGLPLLRAQNAEWSVENTLNDYTHTSRLNFSQSSITPTTPVGFTSRSWEDQLRLNSTIASLTLKQKPWPNFPGIHFRERVSSTDCAIRIVRMSMRKLCRKPLGTTTTPDQPVPTSYLSLTRTQGALMKQWTLGKFISDWKGIPPKPAGEEITPEGLDRAALENCVGGAFYPGIEVSWLIRKPEVFSEPFRIKHGAMIGPLTVRAGFFSPSRWPCPGRPTSTPVPRKSFVTIRLDRRFTHGGRRNDRMTFSNRESAPRWFSGREDFTDSETWLRVGQPEDTWSKNKDNSSNVRAHLKPPALSP